MIFIYSFFLLKIIIELISGLVLKPFNTLLKIPYTEIPQIHCLNTDFNRNIIRKLPIHNFKCPSWLTGSVIQSSMLWISNIGSPFYREMLAFPDGVEIALDIKENPNMPSNTPLVVICHGLAGSSKDPSINMYANEIVNKLNWRCIVYIRRGHGGTSIAPKSMKETGKVPDDLPNDFKLFPKHCDVEDMEYVCNYIFKKYPDAPKFLAGLSAGSNLIVKYLAECNHQFLAGISLCNGLHLNQSVSLFDKERPRMSHLLTERYKSILRNNLSDIEKLANKLKIAADFKKMLRSTNISSFDKSLLPLMGYKENELDKYYMENSCFYNFEKVNVPLLCLATMDDPIISRSIPYYSIEGAKNNKNVITIITERGGHLGWITGLHTSWSSDVFTKFFETILCSKQ